MGCFVSALWLLLPPWSHLSVIIYLWSYLIDLKDVTVHLKVPRDLMILSLYIYHNWFVMTGKWCGKIESIYSLVLVCPILLVVWFAVSALRSMHVLTSDLVLNDRWRLASNVRAELHNRILIPHVKCRGAYLLRSFDILDICTRISAAFFSRFLHKRAAALKTENYQDSVQTGLERQ